MSTKDEKILEKITKILISITKMEKHVETNTKDLATHILRTDILQNKVRRVEILIWLGAGAGLAEYGPNLLKIIGNL